MGIGLGLELGLGFGLGLEVGFGLRSAMVASNRVASSSPEGCALLEELSPANGVLTPGGVGFLGADLSGRDLKSPMVAI